jgi:hypothetical protein
VVDLRKAGIGGRVGHDESVDVGVAEVATHGVHHRHNRGVHQAPFTEPADVQLDVAALNSDQGVESVGLAPAEPLAQLVGVQGVGTPGVPGEVEHGGQLGGGHRGGLERQQSGRTGHGSLLMRRSGFAGPRPPPTRPGTRTSPTLARGHRPRWRRIGTGRRDRGTRDFADDRASWNALRSRVLERPCSDPPRQGATSTLKRQEVAWGARAQTPMARSTCSLPLPTYSA